MNEIITVNPIPAKFTTYWTIMPADTNYMFPLVFGGAMMAQVDLAAAAHARMLLHWSDCDKAVTHKAHFDFWARAYAGDTIRFDSTIAEIRNNAIRFEVKAYKYESPSENTGELKVELIGVHELVFVTMKGDQFMPHNLAKEFEVPNAD